MNRCSYCKCKAFWSCDCRPDVLLCTFHTKWHKTNRCRLRKPIPRLCSNTMMYVYAVLNKNISELENCIQEVRTDTANIIELIKRKSAELISRLTALKYSYEEKLKYSEFCLEEAYNIVTTVKKRCDSIKIHEKCISDFFDQDFFKNETKLGSLIGHTEQAKFIISRDYKLHVEGHFDCITSAISSRDNRFAISAGDETVRIWDLEQLTQEAFISSQDNTILCIALTRNSKYLIGGGSDSVVYVWDFLERKAKCDLKGHTKSVISLAVGKSNEVVVSGGEDGKVKIWNFVQKVLLANFDAHKNRVKSVIFSKDSKFIVSGGWDENVKVWKFKKKSLFLNISLKPDYVNSVCLNASNLVIVAHGSKISIYNIFSKKLEQFIKAHDYRVNALSLSHSGKYLVSAGQDSIIKLWAIIPFVLLKKYEMKSEITSLFFSFDEDQLIVGSENKTLQKIKTSTGEIKEFEGHTDTVTCIKATMDNRYIITGGTDNDIRVWDVNSRTSVAVLRSHTDWITVLLVLPNNRYLVSGSADKTVKIWDLKSFKCEYDLTASSLPISTISFNPLLNLLITGTEALALVWRIKENKLGGIMIDFLLKPK